MVLHTKYQGFRLCDFRQEYFFMFLTILLYLKHVTRDGAIFGPMWHNLNKLGRGSLGDASYQISRL